MQWIFEPTRVEGVGAGNTLDLLLTNDESLLSKITVDPPIAKSDHVTTVTIVR